MTSIKGNVLLNGINTISGIFFPMITFPYAARVLMPDGLGEIDFLHSIISYIVLLTSLGIPMYAVKEVAKCRDDKPTCDKLTIEIIILGTSLSLLGYFAVWLLAKFVPQIHRQSTLFYILSLSIIFNAIGVNWFYQGIEDFKYITTRALIIRTLSAIALFVFVHKESDLLIYGIILVGTTVGNNLINFIRLRNHLDIGLIHFRELNVIRHLIPSIHVFLLNAIISLYVQLNSIMLGFLSDVDAVAYFSAGTKIPHIGVMLIASLGTVLLPRCSHLLKSGDLDSFKSVIAKSLNVTLMLSIPLTVGLMLLATPLIMIFCGNQYLPSISVLCLNAPVIILISLTNVMGIQVLYSMDKANLVIISVAVAAILNVLLNFLLIPSYGTTGAAISTLIAEFSVLLLQILIGRKYYPFNIYALFNMKYIVATVIMGITVYISILPIHNDTLQILIGGSIGIVTYFLTLLIIREPLAIELLTFAKNKLG